MTLLTAIGAAMCSAFLASNLANGHDGRAAIEAGCLVFLLLAFVHFQIGEVRCP